MTRETLKGSASKEIVLQPKQAKALATMMASAQSSGIDWATLLVQLLPMLMQAGLQLVPLVQALMKYLTDQKSVARPDLSDAEFKALEDTIRALQASIDAA